MNTPIEILNRGKVKKRQERKIQALAKAFLKNFDKQHNEELIQEITVDIKTTNDEGKRKTYLTKTRVITDKGTMNTKQVGWKLPKIIKKAFTAIQQQTKNRI